MSVLSDARLIESIVDGNFSISPFVLENVQPASIDVTLDAIIRVPEEGGVVKVTEDNSGAFKEELIKEKYMLLPGKMILGQLKEKISIPRDCNAHVHNRSSLARCGLNVSAASYVNPGYAGNLPLIIKNMGPLCIELVPGMRICQLELSDVEPSPLRDYSQRKDTKYFGEAGSLVSKIHLDREFVAFKNQEDSEKKQASLEAFLQDELDRRSRNIMDSISDDLKKELGLL